MLYDPGDALIRFLAKTLTRHKVERFSGFVRTSKHRRKFFDAMHHDLQGLFDQLHVVHELPEKAWGREAFVFRPRDVFGERRKSLREAHEHPYTPVLAITDDGKFGFFRSEGRLDSELLLQAEITMGHETR